MVKIQNKWDLFDYLKILPAIIIAGVIFYFSSLPHPLPPPPPGQRIEFDLNSLLHIAEYTLFSFLVAFGFRYKAKDIYLIIFPILFALTDEIHQYFVPNRYFDFYDILMDAIGVFLGFIALLIFEFLYFRIFPEKKDFI